jgi:hypothetical protein
MRGEIRAFFGSKPVNVSMKTFYKLLKNSKFNNIFTLFY